MLYIVDFLTQFSKVLAMKPISFKDFCQSLYSTAATIAPPDGAATANPTAHAHAQLPGSTLAALAAPSAVVNGYSNSAPGSVNEVLSNGLLASIGAEDQVTGGDSTVLFDVYRGLLQFLLQVCILSLLSWLAMHQHS